MCARAGSHAGCETDEERASGICQPLLLVCGVVCLSFDHSVENDWKRKGLE